MELLLLIREQRDRELRPAPRVPWWVRYGRRVESSIAACFMAPPVFLDTD